MTKKSKFLFTVAGVSTIALGTGIIVTSIAISSYQNQIVNKEDPQTYKQTIEQLTPLTANAKEFIEKLELKDDKSLEIYFTGIPNNINYTLSYKTQAEPEYKTISFTSQSPAAKASIPNFDTTAITSIKLAQSSTADTIIFESLIGYQSATPIVEITPTGRTAAVKVTNLVAYAGVKEAKLQFTYKLASSVGSDFIIAPGGPFDISLDDPSFSIKVESLVPNSEYQWELVKSEEKTPVASGSFKTANANT
ncbi:hypothetical protein NV226_02670 [Mycoplasma iguanae]|uniref:Uncharacterized protein n=1 Tax=Mycoplasma iguanae TaxID=292461 RepID=A0ABY5R7Z3_9MOLU|nr:hypothetical protein [Mycoplasma iguanae]UVD81603.1 hypothetical protein NV226_02670 [Mycoplasma iguanae]